MAEKIIQKGAEANIIKSGDFVIKDRVVKGYRYPELDNAIRRRRTRKEAKLLMKASEIIDSPKPYFIPLFQKIKMPFIDGLKLSESLDDLKDWKDICLMIGENIAKLHDADIIHGDLTTSNMIYSNGKVFFVDFGLGFANGRIEDKAVDLHLIKQALEAKHFKHFDKFFKVILKGYEISENYEKVVRQLEKVEKRGRYKEQY